MSTFLRHLWQRIRNPTGLVGRDLEGNRYFEYPNPHGAFGRTKRMVKYREGFDMWTYVAGEKRLPVQWSAWLTHTRVNPPALEELQADLERQRRVRLKAAMIEARDTAASIPIHEPQVQSPSNPSQSLTPNARIHGSEAEHDITGTPRGNALEPRVPQQTGVTSPTPPKQTHSSQQGYDEPQAWIPRSARRVPS